MKTASQVQRVPLPNGRVDVGALIKRVHRGKKYIILEKDGVPVAGLMDLNELEDYLELTDPKVREQIRKSNEEYLAGKSRPLDEYLAEVAQRRNKKVSRRAKA